MFKNKIIILYICLGVLLSSCDDFLTTPPLDEVPDTEWWKNKDQVLMMVNDAYTTLPNHYDIAYGDCASDNAKVRSGGILGIGNGTHDTQNGRVLDSWKYSSIARLNYILEGIEKSKDNISETEYRQYRGQVRFLRAYHYYYMAFHFGDIPLIEQTLTVSESRETSRQPKSEVLNFVFTELDEVLKDVEGIPVTETSRVNTNVVNAFLGRAHLYEGNHKEALTYLNKVIKTGDYELYHDYDRLFRPQSDGNNKEVIFERQYAPSVYTHDLNRNLSPSSSIYSGWSQVLILQSLVDEYECINGHPFKECESLNCEYVQKREDIENPTKRGEYKFRDPRLHATVMYPFWEWKVGDEVRSIYGVDDPDSKDYVKSETHMSGYLCTKWVDLEGENADRTRAHKNMTIIRYADVLLMKAECLIELDQNFNEAVSLINQIRKRAGMPTNILVTNQSDLQNVIRHERHVETALENLRYYDIIRWKIAESVKSGNTYGAKLKAVSDDMDNKFMEERYWDDKMYLFPIPQAAIDVNPNLTQNPGWK